MKHRVWKDPTPPMTQIRSELRVPAALGSRDYRVLRRAVPRTAVEGALRHVHLDVMRRGLPMEVIASWVWGTHWFPHLRWDPPIVALAWHLPEDLRDGEMCDPQIVLQPPDDDDVEQPLLPHVDEEPEWARGRRYRSIVGVALSRATPENGGLRVWPSGSDEPVALTLEPGDAVLLHPSARHASGVNREGGIRYAVYFRFLEGRRQ